MSKDPAILFFTSDFLTGTMFMTNEQVGIYIRLLCAQHQHGGIIDKASFNSIVAGHDIVKQKFEETDDGFFNSRMMEEIQRRNQKSNNLSNAALDRWEKHKQNTNKKEAGEIAVDANAETITKIIEYFNQKGKLSFKTNAEKNRKPIRARLNEKFVFDDFVLVIDYKVLNWGADPKMKDYLRPETIFGNKFESYLMASKSNTIQISPIQNTANSYQEAAEKLGLK